MNRIISLSKIAKGNAGYRFVGSASDDRVDSKGTRLSMEIFRDFIKNQAEYGNPFFDVAHYPDGRIGVCDQLWIDGHYLKVGGSFDESELAEAAIRGLLEDKNRPVRKIQQSVGFYPRAVAYEDLVLVYLSGWLEHSALTTVPVNQRTDIHLLMAAKAITKLDDASAIVGAELASLLEEKDRARYAFIEDRSLFVPDLPLGRKADAVLEALASQLCVTSPLLLFADTLPDVPAGAAEPFLLDQDVERWLEAATGRVDLTSAPIVLLSRRLIERRLGVEMSLSDGDVVELMSSRPSYAYLTRLCDLLKETVDERTWAAAHRAARGHAGGKGYPSSATAVSVAEYEAAPNSKLSELCSSDSPAKLARALLAIYEANRRANIDESERLTNVRTASEEFRKALLAGLAAKRFADENRPKGFADEEGCPAPDVTMRSVAGTHTQSEASDLLGLDRCRQIVYGVVLVPEEEDEDGFCVSALEIEKAAHKFLTGQRQIWLRHQSKIAQANVVESYCAPADLTFNDAFGLQSVPKGSWIVGVHVADPDVWQEIANGTLRGLSLRALVSIQEDESHVPPPEGGGLSLPLRHIDSKARR